MTEQEIRRVRDRWDRAYDMLGDVRRSIIAARRVEKSLEDECERLAELINEHDNTEIVIAGESAMDGVVCRAESGELAMRVDVADIDGETA